MEEKIVWLKDELASIEQKINLEEYRLSDAKSILEELENLDFTIPYGHAPAFAAGDRYENPENLVDGVYWEDENPSISGIRKGMHFEDREGEVATVSKDEYLKRIEELEKNFKDIVKSTKSDRSKLKIKMKIMEMLVKVKQTILGKKEVEMLNAGNGEHIANTEEEKVPSWVLTEEAKEIANAVTEPQAKVIDESQKTKDMEENELGE